MKAIILSGFIALGLATAVSAQQMPQVNNLASLPTPKAPPANLLPTGIGGAVVYVRNLEAQRNWYQTMLGFKVRTPYARDGKVFEYIMVAGSGETFMGIATNDLRPAGMNTNTRVVLQVPNPKGLADFMSSQGVYVREAIPNSAYMIFDPEGNQIELYKAPAK
jgi:catechol-2,3-dioxygenase